MSADLTLPDGAVTLLRRAREFLGERLDILVANAGIFSAATIEAQTVEAFDRLFAVNV